MNSKDAWLRFLAAAVLLVGTNLFLHAHRGVERLPRHEQLASFPLRVGDWLGTDLAIQPEVREVLGEGDFLARVYRRTSGEPPIDLFLAYFPTQRTGSTMHSPQNCLPGAGWTPIDHALVPLESSGGRSLTVNRYVIAKGLDRDLVLYWYQAHGRVVASEYWAKFYLVADSIRMNRSDAALVRITTPLKVGGSVETGQKRVVEFAHQLTPLLDGYIPR